RLSRDWSSDVCSSDLGPFNLTARIDVIQIGIEQHLDHHTRVETCGTSAFIPGYDMIDVQFFNHFVNQTYRMTSRDFCKNIFRKKTRTIVALLLSPVLFLAPGHSGSQPQAGRRTVRSL